MSYKDIRSKRYYKIRIHRDYEMFRVSSHNFCKLRLISKVDSFRTPNFELVSDLLYWMAYRYDSHINISDNISTENDRVQYLTTIAQVLIN